MQLVCEMMNQYEDDSTNEGELKNNMELELLHTPVKISNKKVM
jgi:hypothetical protein